MKTILPCVTMVMLSFAQPAAAFSIDNEPADASKAEMLGQAEAANRLECGILKAGWTCSPLFDATPTKWGHCNCSAVTGGMSVSAENLATVYATPDMTLLSGFCMGFANYLNSYC